MLLHDLRLALRSMLRTPILTALTLFPGRRAASVAPAIATRTV